jgi:hypothetical protein
MPFGQAIVTLRPLKFATLVELADHDALLEAIRINTFLWGGTYNPIIPIFSDTPENWSYGPLAPPPPAEILSGYIRSFDPDILVTCGKIDPSKIESQRRMIVPAGDITKPISPDGIPGYGIGLPEILAELGRQEFKFIRRDELKVLSPTLEVPTDPLLAAIFRPRPARSTSTASNTLTRIALQSRSTTSLNSTPASFSSDVTFVVTGWKFAYLAPLDIPRSSTSIIRTLSTLSITGISALSAGR